MRVRNSDELTNVEFHIGVCRQCSRYGQLDKTTRKCEVAELPKDIPPFFVLTDKQKEDHYERVKKCNRIATRKAERKAASQA